MAKILVVDDSGTVRDEVAGFLRNHGLDVATAVDGKDGLAKLKATPGVRLVISDVNMPNMDGISLVRAVKELPAYRFTPIVMLTTESQEAKKKAGQEAGAKAWMLKPFKPEQMVGVVQKLVLP